MVGTVHRPDHPHRWARQLLTLRDAAAYITSLPKAEHETGEWQTAMEVLLLVAERDGIEMLARLAVMRALNRHGAKATPAPRSKIGLLKQVFGVK